MARRKDERWLGAGAANEKRRNSKAAPFEEQNPKV
jgi:hypothetical protein